jgi:Spy/CpxP family protein refolding chaperone
MKMTQNISIICGLIFFLIASPALAQRKSIPEGRNFPLSESPCWTKTYLEATPEQLKALGESHRAFSQEISSLRNQFFMEGRELRALLSNPNPEAKMVLSRQNNLSTIQKKIDEVSMQYFLKARSIFTPEQMSKLPPECRLGFNYGLGMGWSRGMGPRNRF